MLLTTTIIRPPDPHMHLQLHPNHTPRLSSRRVLPRTAYDVLTDPEKKRKYDAGVDPEDLDNPHAGMVTKGPT